MRVVFCPRTRRLWKRAVTVRQLSIASMSSSCFVTKVHPGGSHWVMRFDGLTPGIGGGGPSGGIIDALIAPQARSLSMMRGENPASSASRSSS
jgi:hypothetical protein